MKEIMWVEKDMTVWNWTSSYKWVSDKQVRMKIRESMIKHWLVIYPVSVTPKFQIDRWEEEVEDYKTKKMVMKTKQSVFTEVISTYKIVHTSWESDIIAGYWHWVDTQDKWAGKATTYALKNTLLSLFLIPTWVDTDDTHSDDLPTPPPVTTPKKEEDNRPWFNEKEYTKMIDWVWSIWKEEYENYKKELRDTYRFTKEMWAKVKDFFDNL